MNKNQIAELCHNVNKAYCESIGDLSQPKWEDAPDKTHPCLVPYNELPVEQKTKDYLFKAVIDTVIKIGVN
ncbi:hypothetical protein [Virgibacillus salexigens]|uniref:Ryanodine receptor Ryr domain-containing protein n=1 Tax=Virgibacillus massiliensis TaxID=1462526 RepID=A0A024QH01_9BACI|nr:hypothetical protein [Virgibacillus massiliensis]CDQ41843.1 hypothetical protein BN990_04222 [Virgibacillus massiliensis]